MASKRFPKDLLCSIYSPNKKLAELVVRLRNVPGAMARVSELLESKRVNILSGFHSFHPEEESGPWSFFVDLTSVDIKPCELAEQIGKLDVVLDVFFSEARFGDLIVDNLHFPTVVSGERSVVFRVETFGDMFGRLYEAFGSGAAVILHEMGVSAGENKVKNVIKRYCVNGLKAMQIILAERVAKGWGVPEITEFDGRRLKATVAVKDLFECLPFKGKQRESKSQFFRGYLTGVFNQLFKKRATTTEVECIAKGDGHCKFVIE